MSQIECELLLEYDEEEKASIIKKSLEPDNDTYIDIYQEKNKLIAKCGAKKPMELIHTMDDFLACLTISEDTIDK